MLLFFSSQAQSFSPLQELDPPLTGSNINWNFNMGYRFEATVDGDVTALGGKWRNGVSHTVRLYAYPAGTLLGSASVSGNGNWNYTTLATAITLNKGAEYVVAVRLDAQTSGQYSNSVTFPYNYGGIEILGTCFLGNSNAMPTNLNTTNSYGQADIIFEPCAYAGQLSANKTKVIQGSSTTLNVVNFTGAIKWQSSTDNVNFADIPGQFGSQLNTGAINTKSYFRTVISAGACTDTSNTIEISIIDPDYPLQLLDLTLVAQDINWDYNMGYRFRPTKDGQITELGGRWTGGVSHTVRLYDFSSGNILASATVSGSPSWNYTSIVPVNVTAGTDYVVAVRLDNQNSGLYSNATLPQNSGNIEIVNTLFRASSNLIPNSAVTNRMYGQADVKFEACVSAGTIVAETSPVFIYDSTKLFATGNTATVTWQTSTDGNTFTNAGSGDTLHTGKLTNSRYYRTIVNGTCANDTSEVFKLKVLDPNYVLQGAQPELLGENINWDYNMGYRFTANINGRVEELGGRWANGVSHTVRLYSSPGGTVLASANVTGVGDDWAYQSITPVNLTAGTEYVVAVRLTANNSGVNGRVPGGLPYVRDNITINSTIYRASSNLIPNINSTTAMYGWADMKFVPCVEAGEIFPSDTNVCSTDTFSLELKYSQGNIQWQSSTNGTSFNNVTGATDTVLTVNSASISTFYRAVVSSACGSDTTENQLIVVSGSGQVGLWTGKEDDDWFNVCNWADGTVPVNGDSAIFVPGTNVPTNIPQVNLRYLSLNNVNGLSLTNRLRVNDSLDLINGKITLNNENLIIGPNANIGNNFGASYIVCNGNGAVRLRYNAANIGVRRVPIGDDFTYTYAEFNLVSTSALGGGAYIAIRTVATEAPNTSSPFNKLDWHWLVSGNSITAPVYSATFLYDDSDVIGSESDLSLQLYNGSTWIKYSAANASQNTISGTGLTQFGTFSAFDKEAIQSAQTGPWNQTSSWVGGVIPDTNDQALIISPHTISLNANTNAGGIDIATGATLNLQTNDLRLRGNLLNNGNFSGTGTLSFDGNSSQDIGGSSELEVEILEINNAQGVEISSGEVLIKNRLEINSGTLTTNGNLTLVSDSNRTANLGEVTGVLSGTIKAQRYIDGVGSNIGWRHLTSPIQSTTLRDLKYNVSANPKGIYFYGFAGSNQSWNWANAYRFSEPAAGISGNFDDGWIPATHIDNAISYTLPYTIYTGGRNFPEYDLEIEGFPNVGTMTISGLSLTGTNRWHLIGNPYPSSIDWSLVSLTGVDAIAYLFSETNGGYISSNLLPSPNHIASFQGFFIRVNNATNSIIFNENDKITADAPFQKALAQGDRLRMRLLNTNNGRWSPAAIDWIEGATPNFDSNFDAYKLYNGPPFPNLGIFTDKDTIEFQVSADSPGASVYTHFLRTITAVSDTMELQFEEFPTSAKLCMRLYDRELDSVMLVDEGFTYRFYLADTTNFARFELSTFDVDMGPQVEHISCFGEGDGKIKLGLPEWTRFNVNYFDTSGQLINSRQNVWLSDSITGLEKGDYRVEIQDTSARCRSLSALYSIFELDEVISDFEMSTDSLEIGESLILTNLSQASSQFFWNLGDGNIDSSLNVNYNYQMPGNYTISLLSMEGACTDTSSRELVVYERSTVSLMEEHKPVFITMNTNELTVSGLGEGMHELILYNVQGQISFRKNFEGPSLSVAGLNLSSGVYIMKLDKGQYKISVQ